MSALGYSFDRSLLTFKEVEEIMILIKLNSIEIIRNRYPNIGFTEIAPPMGKIQFDTENLRCVLIGIGLTPEKADKAITDVLNKIPKNYKGE